VFGASAGHDIPIALNADGNGVPGMSNRDQYLVSFAVSVVVTANLLVMLCLILGG
jgi:hypothetical protein